MTALLRLYLGATALLAGPLSGLARRRHRRIGADPGRFAERQGRATLPRPAGRLIWVHAASMGEVSAVADLAQRLAQDRGANVLVTTLTETGAATVARRLPGALQQFLPLDTPGPVARFLDHWRPDLGVIVESDLWPRLILRAAAQMPLALVNARPSRSRARMPKTSAALLSRFGVITAQGPDVAQSLRALGLRDGLVHATGDLKAAAAPPPADPLDLASLRQSIGLRPCWAAVSTHAGDEVAVLSAHSAARHRMPDLLLILAPRHPDRAEAISAAAQRLGLTVARRSQGGAPNPQTAILLADTLGETGLWFRLSPVVFLGGSFGPEGGHNPYEPAALGCAILSGPHTAHFAAAYNGLQSAGGALACVDAVALAAAVIRLGPDPSEAGARAKAFHATQIGALDRTLPLLVGLLP